MVVNILLVIAVLAALAAVESRKIFNSVVAFGIMGLLLCVTFLLLGSFDLALIQLAIEVALLLSLLKFTQATGEKEIQKGWALLNYLAAVILVVVFTWFSFDLFRNLPGAGANVQRFLALNLFNLLGVAGVVFGAVVGAAAVLRPKGKDKEAGG
ncbi:MAG: DUF4040 domain-containing protein [Candidatus Margulisbacteria bacterium]|nr:DUF4040 domain-containing protein [Candidatus Margulisiibacteriota bacterium]